MVCAGQLVRSKGFDVAIAALARLPDTELLVAGEQIPKDPEAARL
jgi:glycosyltransferase involved in cell wall biosynthesis